MIEDGPWQVKTQPKTGLPGNGRVFATNVPVSPNAQAQERPQVSGYEERFVRDANFCFLSKDCSWTVEVNFPTLNVEASPCTEKSPCVATLVKAQTGSSLPKPAPEATRPDTCTKATCVGISDGSNYHQAGWYEIKVKGGTDSEEVRGFLKIEQNGTDLYTERIYATRGPLPWPTDGNIDGHPQSSAVGWQISWRSELKEAPDNLQNPMLVYTVKTGTLGGGTTKPAGAPG